jgi:hypothetical protein
MRRSLNVDKKSKKIKTVPPLPKVQSILVIPPRFGEAFLFPAHLSSLIKTFELFLNRLLNELKYFPQTIDFIYVRMYNRDKIRERKGIGK